MESDRLKSEHSMDLDGFIDNLYVLLKAAWGEDWGVFSMNKPNLTDGRDVKMPQIVYTVPKIEPGSIGTHKEIKPRLREKFQEINQLTGETGWVEIYGKILDCQVDFIVYAENNRDANLITKRFRQLLDAYKGLLMKKGMQNLWYLQESDRNPRESSEEMLSARTISYLVRIEELSYVEINSINSIELKVNVIYDRLATDGLLPSQQP